MQSSFTAHIGSTEFILENGCIEIKSNKNSVTSNGHEFYIVQHDTLEFLFSNLCITPSFFMKNAMDTLFIQNSMQNIVFEKKAERMWTIFHKQMIQGFDNISSASEAKDLMHSKLHTFYSQCSGSLSSDAAHFTNGFIEDIKEKPLSSVREKYFMEGRKSILDFNSPIVKEMFEIFTASEKMKSFFLEEEESLASLIDSQVQNIPKNRNEMLRLMAFIKDLKRSKEGGEFDCYVLDASELDEFIRKSPHLDNKRMQLIIRNDVHYTAVDCLFSKQGNQCLVMDAALDPRYLDIVKNLKNSTLFQKIYVASDVKIQMDGMNCGTFSFAQTSKSSKMKDLFTLLAKKPFVESEPGIFNISWANFDGSLIKNAQTTTFIKKHEDLNLPIKSGGETLMEYLARNLEKREITTDRGTRTVDANVSIERKFNRYVEITTICIQRMPQKGAAEVAYAYPVTQFSMRNNSK